LRVLGVIPARFGSTRFAGKALADLGGKPLVVHVVERAREARALDRVVVATDDERIASAAREAGAEAVMTPAELPSGSDRVAFVERSLSGDSPFDVVVNIQGDEPFLPGGAVDRAVELLERDAAASMATLAVPVEPEEVDDPNVVKVVLDKHSRALYFSRRAVPYGGEKLGYLKHVGLYAFRRDYLRRWVALGVSGLESAERLEQLRALEDGAKIAVAVGDWPVLGVDTPQDLIRAERKLARRAAEEKEKTA
jgi:3-deoxy-manno-octulosonate cytidylyltransferase (CMP-KDO synthetase)